MFNVLFLDDDPNRTKRFVSLVPSAHTVETASECIDKLNNNDHWHLVCLDHDLGGEIFVDTSEYNTGTTVARWINENKPSIDFVVVHSFNHPAAKGMMLLIEEAGYRVVTAPFNGTDFNRIIESLYY